MKLKISFTIEDLEEPINKTLCYLEDDQLFLSNFIDIKYASFFKEILPPFAEIVIFEHDTVVCPECGSEMDSNGSRVFKPNKLEGFRKKQYVCPDCGKSIVTKLDPFISENCNFSHDICEKSLNYEYIGMLDVATLIAVTAAASHPSSKTFKYVLCTT